MPAHDGGATYTAGRRTKTSKGGNRDGWASRRLGRYGDLSRVEGQQQRRLRRFKRLAGTGDAHASGVAGSTGEDWRGRTGVDAMSLRAPSWLVEHRRAGGLVIPTDDFFISQSEQTRRVGGPPRGGGRGNP